VASSSSVAPSSSSVVASSSSVAPSSSSVAPSSSSVAPSSSSVASSSSVVASSSSVASGNPTTLTTTKQSFPVGNYSVTFTADGNQIPNKFRCYVSSSQQDARTIGTYTPPNGTATNMEISGWQTQTNSYSLGANTGTVTFNITVEGVTCNLAN